MKISAALYKRHRFPSEIIQYIVWLYHQFNLSHRDIEDLLAEEGIVVTHESIVYIYCVLYYLRGKTISLINICIFHPAIVAEKQLTCQYRLEVTPLGSNSSIYSNT